jgi:uncharacterized Zn finger protein
MAWSSRGGWPTRVSAAERRKRLEKEVAALRKKGRVLAPVAVEGTKIARTFWGKAWCDNLESYSDFASRLPRGRTYVRSGAILHLEIAAGRVDALVRGTETYDVKLTLAPLAPARWSAVIDRCAGEVTSLVELLGGKLSKGVMAIVTDRAEGLFPAPAEITLSCSCPDWATMCKHVAATMYGVGARLDDRPELLFLLRGVDPTELVARSASRAATNASRRRPRVIADEALAGIFGIDLDFSPPAGPRKRRR